MRSLDDLILDASSKSAVRSGHTAWVGLPKGRSWTGSEQLRLFQFHNLHDRLGLRLWVGPNPS